jgi:hypothetical protein
MYIYIWPHIQVSWYHSFVETSVQGLSILTCLYFDVKKVHIMFTTSYTICVVFDPPDAPYTHSHDIIVSFWKCKLQTLFVAWCS